MYYIYCLNSFIEKYETLNHYMPLIQNGQKQQTVSTVHHAPEQSHLITSNVLCGFEASSRSLIEDELIIQSCWKRCKGMYSLLLAFTAAWGLPVTDGSAHVESLVPV